MRTKDAAIRYAQKYLLMTKTLNINVEKAILFGSYTNNSQNQYSDIDLAIISKDFTENPLENWKKVGLATIKYHRIEPHLFTWKDYQGNSPFLIDEILKTGIEIPIP